MDEGSGAAERVADEAVVKVADAASSAVVVVVEAVIEVEAVVTSAANAVGERAMAIGEVFAVDGVELVGEVALLRCKYTRQSLSTHTRPKVTLLNLMGTELLIEVSLSPMHESRRSKTLFRRRPKIRSILVVWT